jgi:peptide subunit release factor 1 (eRF1)
LCTSDLFDPRLAAVVLKMVDVSYGGENGIISDIRASAERVQFSLRALFFFAPRFFKYVLACLYVVLQMVDVSYGGENGYTLVTPVTLQ